MDPETVAQLSRHARLIILAPRKDFASRSLDCPHRLGLTARQVPGPPGRYIMRLREPFGRSTNRAEIAHVLQLSTIHTTLYSQRLHEPGWHVFGELPSPLYRRRFEVLIGALELSTAIFRQIAGVQLYAMLRFAHKEGERSRLERLEQALVQLETDLQGGWTMEALAITIGMTPSQFSKDFKNCFGCAPHRYLDLVRIAEAHRFLVHSDHSLADTAYALGFSSQAHFTTAFGTQTGRTPAVYRESIRKRLGV